ncbi:hypothetical protein LR48_Vigan10g258800 [Vigna angularis]|uniref:Zinc finger GRF-type domain-containing protein n=1 Tax=Phaseolus angularis TaxID=3914 RepID=A0A0L9VNQ4_PHAAN|nr:hypothetical protein LR48_Vigan10g258800 [Vigna angularis]
MKGDRGGCTPRSIGSGMSQSCGSSHLASKNCGCGERLLLLKATTLKNKGRQFYRCRNWAVVMWMYKEVLNSINCGSSVQLCLDANLVDVLLAPSRIVADPPPCDADAAPAPATVADLLPACGADAYAPLPAIDAALPACDADADAPFQLLMQMQIQPLLMQIQVLM